MYKKRRRPTLHVVDQYLNKRSKDRQRMMKKTPNKRRNETAPQTNNNEQSDAKIDNITEATSVIYIGGDYVEFGNAA
jgi:hypothetical protein